MRQHKIEEIKESNTEALTIDLKDVSNNYEYLIQYLSGMRGGSNVLLGYVARISNGLHPKTSINDPVSSYKTHDEEMVKREPIILPGNLQGTEEDGPFEDYFITDRGKVWDLISPIIIKKEAWPHIKCARTSCDSRISIFAFHDCFLGPNNVDHIYKQSEQNLFYLS